MRRDSIPTGDDGPYPEDEEAEDHCCWLSMPLRVQIANIADVVCHIRRHSNSRTASAAEKLLQSSYGAVRAFLKRECAGAQLTDADVAVLWGREGAATSTQAAAVSHALGLLQNWFTQILHADLSREQLPSGFREDFVKNRMAALEEYVKSSCNKLKGSLAVQSLASGDVDVGAEMMKQWLKGGDAGLKSLGALIQAGYDSKGQ